MSSAPPAARARHDDVTCPRCGAAAAETQEYCLQCGLRLPGRAVRDRAAPRAKDRPPAPAHAGRRSRWRRGARSPQPETTARRRPRSCSTGGSVTVAAPATGPKLAAWPAKTDAWTIVLQSIPKTKGRAGAVAVADAARQRGLLRVGILDSGRFASLHPGYWTVFTGVYETQPDANGALQQARAVVKTAARSANLAPELCRSCCFPSKRSCRSL